MTKAPLPPLAPRPGWVWYFAYGSNMNPERLFTKRLKPEAVPWGRRIAGRLDGWRLAFDKSWHRFSGAGAANIHPAPGSTLYGTLNEMPPSGLAVLDHYEGVADGHYERLRLGVVPLDGDGRPVEAIAYVARGDLQAGLKPPCFYLAHLLAGRDLLPPDYVEGLERTPCLPGLTET